MEYSNLTEESQAIFNQIRNGSHPDVIRQQKKLQLIKDKKIAAADVHRKLLIQNANNLFSYEVFEATKLCEVSYYTYLLTSARITKSFICTERLSGLW